MSLIQVSKHEPPSDSNGIETFAGWSFRTAIRPIIGPDLARMYEDAIRNGTHPDAENERQRALFGFADDLKRNPSMVSIAAVTWLEPHFSNQESCALVAFAGAVRIPVNSSRFSD